MAAVAEHVRVGDSALALLLDALGAEPDTPPEGLAILDKADWDEAVASIRADTTPLLRSRIGWIWKYLGWISGLEQPPAPATPPLTQPVPPLPPPGPVLDQQRAPGDVEVDMEDPLLGDSGLQTLVSAHIVADD